MGVLSREERRLIDEALAAGRVTRVPQGTSAMPELVWCDRRNGLFYADPAVAMDARRPVGPDGKTGLRQRRRRRAGSAPDPNVEARRARVAEMAATGLPAAEIAAALGVSEQLVHTDAHRLGVALRRPPPRPCERVQARRARVAEIHAAGGGRLGLAALLAAVRAVMPMSETALRGDLEALGLSLRAKADLVSWRRQDVRRMAGERLSVADIAAALGVSRATVTSDMRSMGLRARSGDGRLRLVRDARRMRAEGKSFHAIGRALGVSDTAVRAWCGSEA